MNAYDQGTLPSVFFGVSRRSGGLFLGYPPFSRPPPPLLTSA
jgi:hypothetical protein